MKALLLLLACWSSSALQPRSRRALVADVLGGAATIALGGRAAVAAAAPPTPPERSALVAAIAGGNDDAVVAAIRALEPLDPCRAASRSVREAALDGEWVLRWGSNTRAFSPLLAGPVKPRSTQLIGSAAARDLGEAGRIAQVLDFGGLARVELSSGATTADGREITIRPPFRVDAVVGGRRVGLVDADSDASFRETNARTAEAQKAGANLYVQTYLEATGAPGDLRISAITAGDPVIVGTMFVHERI